MDKNYKLDLAIHHPIPHTDWDIIIPMVQYGLMIELGVSDGTSFTDICKVAYPRKVYGFDWFHGLPEVWGHQGKGIGDRSGEPPKCPENGEFVIGRIEDTLEPFLFSHPNMVAFVHFDLDLYSSTKCGLEHLSPYFETGTILAFDEIAGGGFEGRNTTNEQKAFREWLDQSSFDVEMLGCRHAESWVMRLI